MNYSGKIEHGIDTNGVSRSRKMRTTRLVGSIESGKDVNSRSKGLGSAYAGRRYVKTVSMLIVLCAAAILAVSALALTEASQTTISANARAPGPPHPIYGWTWDADGVTPLTSCDVTVTNLNTTEFIVTTSDSVEGIYSIDMSEFQNGYEIGDILNVTAVKGAQTGWTEAPITDNPDGNDRIDVTLDQAVIPEFPLLILPVGGMIALFAVVSLRRKSKK